MTTTQDVAHWRSLIRDVPDFPQPGILFRDITPLMRSPSAWQEVMRQMGAVCERLQPDLIVGIESRGFIVGTALATAQGIGFSPVRKPGKLPAKTVKQEYALEYGTDALEIHADALQPSASVLVVDDVLATGGTAGATCRLVERAGGTIVACAFMIELTALGGRQRLAGRQISSLVAY